MPPSEPSVEDTSLASLSARTQSEFKSRFGHPASVVVAAPGRVNLIGEHVDYNDGFVLPLALERYVVIAAAIPEDVLSPSTIRVHSSDFSQTESIRVDELMAPGRQGWVSYVQGVIAGFIDIGEDIPAFDAVIGSSVPLGGGLSSSAALEVALATLLEHLTKRTLKLQEKAVLCQQAEHRFAGVPCGIMDQFSSVFGQADNLMLIDCRSQDVQMVPFKSSDVSVLITNSNVKHELTGGEYAQRRSECERALKKLGRASWRDVTFDDVERQTSQLTSPEFRRARHVVSEINRTIAAANAFRISDWDTVGRLMYESHDSLRDDYEVSCHELDVLVEIARTIGRPGGVIGSRMTGGGFGGCTVSLVQKDQLDSVTDSVMTIYESKTKIKPHCFSTRPGRGAHVIKC